MHCLRFSHSLVDLFLSVAIASARSRTRMIVLHISVLLLHGLLIVRRFIGRATRLESVVLDGLEEGRVRTLLNLFAYLEITAIR